MLDSLTLDQMRMLVAIDETGSFTAAARKVARAQSAVSHAIKILEADIGVSLFDRSQRKPVLTEAGQAVLEEARTILSRVDLLKARARSMAEGEEAELVIAASVVTPPDVLSGMLNAISTRYPTLKLTLFVEEVGAATDLVVQGRADLGIVGRLSLVGQEDALAATYVGLVDIVAVAASSHPLSALDSGIPDDALDDHRQLVPTSSNLPRYPNRMVNTVWELADLSLRRRLLLQGLGWGTIPRHSVAGDLAEGRLTELILSARPKEAMSIPLYAIHRRDTPPGPVSQSILSDLPSLAAKARML